MAICKKHFSRYDIVWCKCRLLIHNCEYYFWYEFEKHSLLNIVFREDHSKRIMKIHPVNLALRFILEITALVVFAVWGRNADSGWLGIFLAISLPVFFVAVWGVFAVKGDPSRSGKTVVSTNGFVRLLLELLFFALAALALFDLGFNIPGLAVSVLVLLHYAFSYQRIVWLLKQ